MNINKEFILVVLSFVALSSYLSHINGKNFYNKREDEKKISQKVFDIGHKYIPDLSNYEFYIGNHKLILHNILDILIIIPLIYILIYERELRKYLIVYGLLIFFIRSIFILITILPKHKTCNDENYSFYNLFFGHCYDKIFSGHYSLTLLITILLIKKYPSLFYYGIIYNIIISLLILSTRSHYTIDILVAFIITIFIINTFTLN
jgi:hypothetical protein